MQPRPSRWACDPYEVALGERLAAGLGLSPAIGTVLARRGFREVEEAAGLPGRRGAPRPAHVAGSGPGA